MQLLPKAVAAADIVVKTKTSYQQVVVVVEPKKVVPDVKKTCPFPMFEQVVMVLEASTYLVLDFASVDKDDQQMVEEQEEEHRHHHTSTVVVVVHCCRHTWRNCVVVVVVVVVETYCNNKVHIPWLEQDCSQGTVVCQTRHLLASCFQNVLFEK